MYLVELRPGKEELYRSVDELAAAIRRGDVDAHSRIFHRATSKWISITVHPQFKAIVSAQANEPLPPLPRKEWTFLADGHEHHEHEQHETPPEPGTPPPPAAALEHLEPMAPAWKAFARWRRPLVLGSAGLLLILGVQLAFSGPRPPWTRSHADRATGELGGANSAPASASPERPASSPAVHRRSVVSLASTAGAGEVGYPLPDAGPRRTGATHKPARADSALGPAPVLPKVPAIRLKKMESQLADAAGKSTESPSVESLKAHYRAVYDSAHVPVQTRIDSIVSAIAEP